jgi:PPOX class probable F420-dependent enzyme
MSEARLRELDRNPYFSLETFRRTGVGVKTPVWFAAADGCAYVFSEGKAGKVKRLRNDDRVRVAPCSVRGAVEGEWLEGRARVIDEAAQVEAAYRALRRKYGWQMTLVDAMSKLSGRYDQRAIIEVELVD